MEFVQKFLLTLIGLSLFFLVLGLYKPYWMVWWEDIQNRKKVLSVYLTSAIFFLCIYLVISYLY
ncbi:MAG TPA: hypothetical protein VGA21_13035 [Cyclobacteriaceae bacterium]|jgi:uncharacterized membrane protein YozB (DUF420 family)